MDDLISRQAAIDALDKRFDAIPMEQTTEILLLRRDLRDLPSAEPKTGRWIRCKEQDKADLDNGNTLYECSNCGHADLHAETQEVPYCWYCGADMRGEQDE